MPRGTCTIYNWDGNENGHNIKTEFGVSLSDGAISTLLAWADAKERVSNESRLEDGKRTDIMTPTRFAARTISLEMHLIASDFGDLLAKERAFLAALTNSPEGIILLFEIYGQTLQYRLQYISCTQFAVYGGTLAKYAVRFEERVPNNGLQSRGFNSLSNE